MKLRNVSNQKSAGLILSDGTVFPGEIFFLPQSGNGNPVLGEVVFNTALSGYQEILTDPSYAGQIVVMTYPHIGNYGFNSEDLESKGLYLSGMVAREFEREPSNWRAQGSLLDFFEKYGVAAIHRIDTRALTVHLRDKGAMNAYIVKELPDTDGEVKDLVARLKREPNIGDKDLVFEVTCKEPYEWTQGASAQQIQWGTKITSAKDSPLVAVIDMGVKRNMLRSLVSRGCRVKVYPSRTSAEAILKDKPKGVLLSNGPGDPAKVEAVPDTVRALLGKVPIFGICMGHQILATAIGAKTYKLKFGHHGANQPVLDVRSKQVWITSQNHNYTVDEKTLPKDAQVSQINLNDGSVEGILLAEKRAFSVQYHPEACPGPRDAMIHFDEFMRLMGYGK